MTKTTFQKTTIITTISITVLLAGVFLFSGDMKFAEAGIITNPPPPPSSACPEDGRVQHWDKIIFQLNEIPSDDPRPDPPGEDTPPGEEPPSNPYFGVALDLKIVDPPGEVVNLHSEIIRHLPEDIQALSDTFEVEIIDVRYETVICGMQGPTGPQGPQGDQGDKGDPGSGIAQDIVTRQISDEDTDISKTKQLIVTCGADEEVTGGGYGASKNMHVLYNGPNPPDSANPTGWQVAGVKINGPTGSLEVHAICAKLVP